MAIIQFEDGTRVNFEGNPTPEDVEEVARSLKISKKDDKNLLEKVGTGIKNVGIGAAKGAGQTLQNIGKGTMELITFGKADTSKYGFSEEELKANTPGQKVGKLVEQVAEFALPASKVGLATKGAQGLKVVSGTGKAANFINRGAQTGMQLAPQVASDALVTTAQQGNTQNVKDTIILSSVFGIGGKGISKLRETLRNPDNGGRVINSLIKPLQKDFSYGKNPGKAVAEEGIIANDLDDLAQKINERVASYGDQIGVALGSPEAQRVKIDLVDVFTPIDEAILQAKKAPNTNSAIIKRLQDAKDDLLGKSVDENGNEVFSTLLKGTTPLEATGLKRLVGEITKFTGAASDDNIVNKALKGVYGNIKAKVEEAVPGIKELNERYADLLSAKIATQYREKIAERANLISFTPKILTGSGIGASLFTGNPIPAIVGLGVAGMEKALESPAFKTRFASWLSKSSKAERDSLIKQAPWIRATVLELVGDR